MQLPHVVEFNPWNSGRILLNVRKSTQINVHRREIALAHVTENLEMHSLIMESPFHSYSKGCYTVANYNNS